MRTVARHHPLKLSASLGLLVLAAWSGLPARAADERVAALSRPCSSAAGNVCTSDLAGVHRVAPAAPAAAKPVAAKPAAAQRAASPARQGSNFERDLWRHQGVG